MNKFAGWYGVLMGLATIAAGYSGPAGWVAIVLYYGGGLATFASLTSSTYSTYSRFQLSKNVAQYSQSARDMLYYTNWSNYTSSVVPGF